MTFDGETWVLVQGRAGPVIVRTPDYQECAELLRPARRVLEAVSAVYALRNRTDTENCTELVQARATLRQATQALKAHMKEHKCEA